MQHQSLTVARCMSSPIHATTPSSPAMAAYSEMASQGVRRLPVLDLGVLVGIVSLSDIREARSLSCLNHSLYELSAMLASLRVEHVMTHTPYTVSEDEDIETAARLMVAHRVGCLPVVSKNGAIVGMITESDIFRHVYDGLEMTARR